MTKEDTHIAEIRKLINSVIDKLEIEYTTDQEDVFGSTVGISFVNRWYRMPNAKEVKKELINIINSKL